MVIAVEEVDLTSCVVLRRVVEGVGAGTGEGGVVAASSPPWEAGALPVMASKALCMPGGSTLSSAESAMSFVGLSYSINSIISNFNREGGILHSLSPPLVRAKLQTADLSGGCLHLKQNDRHYQTAVMPGPHVSSC